MSAYLAQTGDRVWRTNESRQHARTIVWRANGTTARVASVVMVVDALLVVEQDLVRATYTIARGLALLAAERFNDATDGWEVARARWVSYGTADPSHFPHVTTGGRTSALYPVAAPVRASFAAPFAAGESETLGATVASLDAAAVAWGWTEVP